jgi:hypothetical protein
MLVKILVPMIVTEQLHNVEVERFSALKVKQARLKL